MKKINLLEFLTYFLASIITLVIIMLTVSYYAEGKNKPEYAFEHYMKQRAEFAAKDFYKTNVKLNKTEQLLDKKLSQYKSDLRKEYKYLPSTVVIVGNSKIQNSNLYKFSKSLPKGADLHVHCYKMLSMEKYIDLMLEDENTYIYTVNDRNFHKLRFFMQGEKVAPGYKKLSEEIKTGRLKKEDLVKEFCYINYDSEDSRNQWKKHIIAESKSFIFDEKNPNFTYKFYVAAFRSYCENNVMHVEIRKICSSSYNREKNHLNSILKAYHEVKKDYPNFTVKIIECTKKKRPLNIEITKKIMGIGLNLKKSIRDNFRANAVVDFIIGFDLVEPEDKSPMLADYAPIFTANKQYQQTGLFLHAGESLNPDNTNVIDAYLYGSKRIGHALNLSNYPTLTKELRKKSICIEVCPLSNLNLGYVQHLKLHPAINLLKQGNPIAICSDDPRMYEHEPLTDDWFAAILYWNLSLKEIKQLCINSIIYSGASDYEKKKMLRTWKKDWKNFVKDNI